MVRPAGPWFVTENFPRTQSENLAKSRLLDRPTVRRSDHGPWSMSVDRDFPYQPLTQTTVDQHGPSFDRRSVGLTVDERPCIIPKFKYLKFNKVLQSRGPQCIESGTQGEVTNAEFWDAIRMFSQVVANQTGRQRGDRQDVADTSRICEFSRINPPDIISSSVTEDPKNFVEKLKKVFEVMDVADAERVELAAYQLKGVARIWIDQWKKSRAKGAPIVTWVVLEGAFMGRFFPRELREAKVTEFLTLKQESMSVHKYILKLTQLSSYARKIVADMRSKMNLFVFGLSCLSSKEGKAVMLIGDMGRGLTHGLSWSIITKYIYFCYLRTLVPYIQWTHRRFVGLVVVPTWTTYFGYPIHGPTYGPWFNQWVVVGLHGWHLQLTRIGFISLFGYGVLYNFILY
ncbi:hypothetical protein MTR67_038762 [Solanum verrucosum]|uniref:Retrotransposon gag domain-containing protein n=1 Tax=Solanum verrucosum TaxID=315347 RepID=A0AAF0ZN18_SOLVR|nr:hypothetical protein MTR67_038762 [Solanum verrucosum]